MISMLSGNGGTQVDLVFYVFTQSELIIIPNFDKAYIASRSETS